MKWALCIVGAALVIACFIPLQGGQRIVGFRYTVSVNNLASDFPTRILSISGNRWTLDDGRVVIMQSETLDADTTVRLQFGGDRVRVDESEVYLPEPAAYCGFVRPERSQLITIPIVQSPLRKYGRYRAPFDAIVPASKAATTE